MESELSMNALFCFVFPPERLLIAAAISAGQSWGKGGRCRRERSISGVPEGMFRLMPRDSRCRRDAEAWATENLGFIGREENRAGRTELMPRFTEACVESGSGLDLNSPLLKYPDR